MHIKYIKRAFYVCIDMHTYTNKYVNKMKVNILGSKIMKAERFLSLCYLQHFYIGMFCTKRLGAKCFACTPEMFGVLSADCKFV